MSAAVSKAKATAAAAVEIHGEGALVESTADDHETLMTYNESSRIPWWVVVVWIIAIIGFGIYLSRYLFPDLALWGSP